MPTVRYTVVEGRILAENRNGNYRFYRSDALGSTVSLYDRSQNKTDSFTYWPYGETQTSSGSTGTKYKYVGTLGCRTQHDGGIYMRARVMRPKDGRWQTVDPLWPSEPAYVYAHNSPVHLADASGSQVAEGAVAGGAIAGPPGALVGVCVGLLALAAIIVVEEVIRQRPPRKREWCCRCMCKCIGPHKDCGFRIYADRCSRDRSSAMKSACSAARNSPKCSRTKGCTTKHCDTRTDRNCWRS